MKTNNSLKTIIIVLILIFTYSCKAQQPNFAIEIIETWVSDDDNLWKIQFTSNGQRIDYYENIVIDSSNYYITNTCGSYTRTNNELFLKSVDSDNFILCELLNNVHTDEDGVKTLSITTARGKLLSFTKQ